MNLRGHSAAFLIYFLNFFFGHNEKTVLETILTLDIYKLPDYWSQWWWKKRKIEKGRWRKLGEISKTDYYRDTSSPGDSRPTFMMTVLSHRLQWDLQTRVATIRVLTPQVCRVKRQDPIVDREKGGDWISVILYCQFVPSCFFFLFNTPGSSLCYNIRWHWKDNEQWWLDTTGLDT